VINNKLRRGLIVADSGTVLTNESEEVVAFFSTPEYL